MKLFLEALSYNLFCKRTTREKNAENAKNCAKKATNTKSKCVLSTATLFSGGSRMFSRGRGADFQKNFKIFDDFFKVDPIDFMRSSKSFEKTDQKRHS